MKKLLLLLPFVTFCFQVSATQFYWVGASGANWSVATNWKMGGFTGSVATTHPRTSSDSAYMGNGSTNATITLDSSFSIRALFFLGSGQIFINGAGKRLTVSGDFNTSVNTGTTGGGTSTIRMAGGTITGNATSEDVGKLPNLLLTGSCSLNGLITMGGSTTFYDSSATISAGTSTVVFYYNDSIKGYPSLNNVEFQGNAAGFVVKDSLLVNGNLNISGSSSWTVNTGTVIALGNIAITCTGSGSYGTGTIRLAGGSSQTISSSAARTQGSLPNVVIAKSGGTLSLSGTISVAGSWANNYSGTINAGTSEVDFKAYYITANIGGLYSTTFYNLTLEGAVSTYNFTIDSAAIVTNLLLFEGNSALICSNHSVVVRGNVSITNTNNGDGGGNATFFFKGAKNQTITSTVGRTAGGLPFVVIAKDSGTLSLSGVISICQGWTNNYSSTQVIPGTSEVYLYGDYHTIAIGGLYPTTFYNLTLEGLSSTYNFSIDSAAIVTNLLLIEGSGGVTLSNHSVVIKGNVSITNTDGEYGGSTTCIFNGNRHQTITSTVARGQCGLINVVIAKSDSLLSLIGTVNIMGGWTNNYGTTGVSAGTSEVYLNGNYGTLTVGGLYSTTFYNLTLQEASCTYNFTVDSAAIVTNLLLLQGSSGMIISNHSIVVKGNISLTNTAVSTGTTVFILNGSENQTISSSVTGGQGSINFVTINKDGGTLSLSGIINVYGNWTNNYSGAINAGTSTVEFVSTYGTVTFGGTNRTTFYQLLLGTNNTYNFALDSAVIVTNQLLFYGGGNIACNNYSALIKGNLQMGQTSVTNCTGSALFYVCGTSSQNFTGYSTPTFANLIIKKPGGTFTLGEPLNISTNLTLTKGNIVTTSTDLLTINNGATVTGASDSSFVSGPVAKAGNQAFRFPVGDPSAAHYKPISISAPSTTSDAFTAQYYNTGIADGLDGVLTYADPCEYWNIAHTTGSSAVHDTLFWNNPCFHIASLSYFKIGYVSGSTWTSVGTCTTSGNTTTGAIAASFVAGNVTLAKTNPLVYAHAGRDTILCGAAPVTLGATPAGTGGTGTLTYVWSPATGLSSSTAANPTATPTVTTTYVVTVTDNLMEYGKDTVVVTIFPSIIIDAGPNYTFSGGSELLGGSPTAGGGGGAFTYAWSPSTGLDNSTLSNPIATTTITSTYVLTVTDINSCTAKDTVTLTIDTSLVAQPYINKVLEQQTGSPDTIHWAATSYGSLDQITIAGNTIDSSYTKLYLAQYDILGDLEWEKTYFDSTGLNAYGSAVITDNDGNVYVAGSSIASTTHSYDYLIQKYGFDGNLIWTQHYNGPGSSYDVASAIAMDASGNIYVTGSSYGSTTQLDFCTIKLDNSGNILWTKRYDYANLTDGANVISVNGNKVTVSGSSAATYSDWNICTIQYDLSGTQLTVRHDTSTGNGNDIVSAIARDNSNNIYLTGRATHGSSYDIVTMKFDSSLNQAWKVYYSNLSYNDVGTDIKVDTNNNVYVCGNLGVGTSINKGLLLKYNSSGSFVWKQEIDGSNPTLDCEMNKLALTNNGNKTSVYVSGSADNGGSRDLVLLKYGDDGTVKYENTSNASFETANPISMKVVSDQEIYFTGLSLTGTSRTYKVIILENHYCPTKI